MLRRAAPLTNAIPIARPAPQPAHRQQEHRTRHKAKRGRLREEVVDAREAERRRTRQKSHGQKVRMIQAKKIRAKHKARRGRVSGDGW